MKKSAILIFIASTNLMAADNVVSEPYDAKPMIEGNRRVDEIAEWDRLHPGVMHPLTEQEKYEFFTKNGYPLPGTGATVVNKTEFTFTKEQSAVVNKFNLEQKTKGYYEIANKHAVLLLAMPETAENEYNERKLIPRKLTDTHLYEVLSDMPLKFKFKGVPKKLSTKIIGYAPEHSFVDNGWTGAIEFFVPSFGGVCAYHAISIELTQTSAYIPREIATHQVNNKLTTINVMGSQETGFVYEVEWWDKKFKQTLECASREYSEDIKAETVRLASLIDKA
jgi:hypothetical protein